MPARGPDQARLARDGEGWSLILERSLPHPAELVWSALTEVDQLAQWGPFIADRDLTSVGPVELRERNVARSPTLDGVVHTVDRPRLLVMEWGGQILRWELSGDADRTHLVLRHRFADRHDAPSFAAGWHLCLDALATLLSGAPTPCVVGDAAAAHGWQELYDRYATSLLAQG